MVDTSMITMSIANTAHFHYIYIDGKEHAKMTGDRMKMLMLTLPFMVRDLIAPEVLITWYILVHTIYILVYTGIYLYILCSIVFKVLVLYQAYLINTAIDNARAGSPLCGLLHISDPSNKVVEVLIQCMDWNIASCQSRIPESELPHLHQKAVDLLDLLQKNLPDKSGEIVK